MAQSPRLQLTDRPVYHLRSALWGACLAALPTAASLRAEASPACAQDLRARPSLQRLEAAMLRGRFISYEPTSLQLANGAATTAAPASIRADLSVLREKFDSLITYDTIHGAGEIAPIASALGFRALVIGVWNPGADRELNAAAQAARRFPQLVVGISLGNETLFAHRSDPQALRRAISRLRALAPATALTTTEPFHIYETPEAAPLLGDLDFLLVNVHPIFQPWFHSASEGTAAQFVVNVLNDLSARACGPILVKETGEPSAPQSAGFSAQRQAAFYRELRRVLPPGNARAFAYFAAFDAPWREYDGGPVPGPHPEEAHWGLYDAERHPKAAAIELPALARER